MVHRMHASRCSRTDRLFVGPVLIILPTLIDPFTKQFDFLFGQRVTLPLRWHDLLVIRIQPHAENHFTILRITHNQGGIAPQVFCRTVKGIQPKPSLAMFLIRSVTSNTFIGENGFDLGIKVHFLFGKHYRCSNDRNYPVKFHNFILSN